MDVDWHRHRLALKRHVGHWPAYSVTSILRRAPADLRRPSPLDVVACWRKTRIALRSEKAPPFLAQCMGRRCLQQRQQEGARGQAENQQISDSRGEGVVAPFNARAWITPVPKAMRTETRRPGVHSRWPKAVLHAPR